MKDKRGEKRDETEKRKWEKVRMGERQTKGKRNSETQRRIEIQKFGGNRTDGEQRAEVNTDREKET